LNLKKGFIAENLGVEYLIEEEFKILDRNFYTKYGELDIVALKGETLHIVEVKSGKSFHPSYNLTNRKLNRILKSLEVYLEQNGHLSSKDISIDLLTVVDDEVEFIENITLF